MSCEPSSHGGYVSCDVYIYESTPALCTGSDIVGNLFALAASSSHRYYLSFLLFHLHICLKFCLCACSRFALRMKTAKMILVKIQKSQLSKTIYQVECRYFLSSFDCWWWSEVIITVAKLVEKSIRLVLDCWWMWTIVDMLKKHQFEVWEMRIKLPLDLSKVVYKPTRINLTELWGLSFIVIYEGRFSFG